MFLRSIFMKKDKIEVKISLEVIMLKTIFFYDSKTLMFHMEKNCKQYCTLLVTKRHWQKSNKFRFFQFDNQFPDVYVKSLPQIQINPWLKGLRLYWPERKKRAKNYSIDQKIPVEKITWIFNCFHKESNLGGLLIYYDEITSTDNKQMVSISPFVLFSWFFMTTNIFKSS